ncbi:MAG: transporter [Salinivirgaceae bacterium]|nr:MAG: transporter [Salinivirgaceae bacterium]
MKKTLFFIILFISINGYLFSQNELVTDRPDQTESSVTVPLKSLQIETGFLMETTKSDYLEINDFAYNTTLFRYGLLENFELRLGLEFLGSDVKLKGADTDTSYSLNGLSPLYVGFKVMVRKEEGIWPEVAFIAGLDIPNTANEDFRPDYSTPSFRFAFSHTLNDRFSLGYNLGAEWDGYTADPGYYYSFVLGASITESVGGFVEAYGTFPEKDSQRHLIDGGFTWLVTPVFQLDFSAGLGLNSSAIDHFISAGLAYRIDR